MAAKRFIFIPLIAFIASLSMLSCGGGRQHKYIIVSEVTHFEIQGNGTSLNFPVFARTIDVEQIVYNVNLAEHYYEKLSAIYDFKSFTFIATTPSEYLLEKEGTLHQPQTIYAFADSISKVDIALVAFTGQQARYAFRISDIPAGQVRDHYVDVPDGQSASIGTLYDREANKGHLIIISMMSQEITNELTPETFADFLKRKNASQNGREVGSFKPSDQRWMDEIFGPGTYKLPLETTESEDIIGEDELRPFDTPPQIIGGIQSLSKNIKYPKSAKADKIEGRVIVKLQVNQHGDVTWVKVVKGVRADLDSAAVDAVKKTSFKPAIYKSEPVSVWIAIPIEFKMQE
ncbi:energy transducer TonB [bacterium]|nr:energy transducer TonB [bacterium]MBU1936852.1 energy transducer TonB [bacterium]